MRDRKMHLLAYVKTGPTAQLAGAWRHPEADLDDIFRPERYEHMARVLEAARFDGCFFADTLGLPDVYKGSFDTYLREGGQLSYLDPMMVLPVMARATNHLGLGATLSTTFFNPYHLARMLASLDHLSRGRACWNVVTSTMDFEARNFGLGALPAKDSRYDRADEVVEACCALWDCWQDDALVMDKASGLFIDPAKVRYADYEGRHVRTRGPLTVPRSPQGRPVLMQAGASPRGRDFAARWAEAIFCSSGSKEDATEFYADIKTRMARFDRVPGDCTICTSMTIVLGETEAIAREKAEYLLSLVPLEMVLATNSAMLGADLSTTGNEDDLTRNKGHQGHGGLEERIRQTMRAEGITFAEAIRRPRNLIVGTPATIADYMQDLFEEEACDGFVLTPTISPVMWEEFARMLTPELQRRRLLRTDYEGATMRENLRS
ncbi:MAG: LLM class flavin-dependent oxidoreductase [Stellaceae bacterium]